MNEVVIDIFFAGLLLVPSVIYFLPSFSKQYIAKFEQSVINSKHALLSLPISVYLIYELSTKSNWVSQLGLAVAFVMFFMTYASALSCLSKSANNVNKTQQSDNES